MILIKGLDMPQGENGLLCLDIYPDGRVFINLNADKGQVATAEQFGTTGHWIKDDKHTVKCSKCGNYLDRRGVNAGRGDINYCPNCGSEMDEVEE